MQARIVFDMKIASVEFRGMDEIEKTVSKALKAHLASLTGGKKRGRKPGSKTATKTTAKKSKAPSKKAPAKKAPAKKTTKAKTAPIPSGEKF